MDSIAQQVEAAKKAIEDNNRIVKELLHAAAKAAFRDGMIIGAITGAVVCYMLMVL